MSKIDNIILLGSTGSIGTQTLEVCELLGIHISGLCAGSNTSLLEKQARRYRPDNVCIGDEKLYNDIKQRLSDTDIRVTAGSDEVCALAAQKTDLVVNAVVGMVGLLPTLAAIKAGNRVALANKESLVTGGELITRLSREKNIPIIPIDSEHSAIFQALMGNEGNRISKIILTASGGPFFGCNAAQLKNVTKAQALAHPNWSMGRKITVDSATMMNKGLELIEAVWLFNTPPEDVEIVIHRQSVLHSAVEFEDGSVIAQLGTADMRIPIQLALTYPKRLPSLAKRLYLFEVG